MAHPVTDLAAFRIRDHYDSVRGSKGYERSYDLIDEQLQREVARCDRIGNGALKPQEILTVGDEAWRLVPNRKLMPNHWLLYDAAGQLRWQFWLKAWGKLVNPFHKTLLTVLDGEGRDQMQLVDLHGAKLAVVTGLEWGKYALVRGEQPLACLTRLPRPDLPQDRGLMGTVRRFFHGSDTALVSADATHALPAPAALALYLLYETITDVSAV